MYSEVRTGVICGHYFLLLVLVSSILEVAWSSSTPSPTIKSHHEDFGYDENDSLGPDHWPEKYKQCAGKYQSPIDIEENRVTRVSLPPLILKGFFEPIESATITNNGHTVMFKANFSGSSVTLSGGPLSTPLYKFAQFHFHWGMNDSMGSEDLINNRSYPMELHIVFFNEDYFNADNATQRYEGLAVLAYFFEVGQTDNPAYEEVINALPSVVLPESTVEVKNIPPLALLLPVNVDNYFTYMGSLTTPPCSEGVRWIDFKHPIYLSHVQLEAFRKIHSYAGILKRNFRPIQPLSSRAVWYNSGSPTTLQLESEKSASSTAYYFLQNNFIMVILVVSLPQAYNYFKYLFQNC